MHKESNDKKESLQILLNPLNIKLLFFSDEFHQHDLKKIQKFFVCLYTPMLSLQQYYLLYDVKTNQFAAKEDIRPTSDLVKNASCGFDYKDRCLILRLNELSPFEAELPQHDL